MNSRWPVPADHRAIGHRAIAAHQQRRAVVAHAAPHPAGLDQPVGLELADLARRDPSRFAVHFAYDESLSHRVMAGADIFLMPSVVDPSGDRDGIPNVIMEALLHRLGIWGLNFLLITLVVTPLREITGQAWLLRFRRMLGLYAFFYVFLHFLVYAGLDQRFDLAVVDPPSYSTTKTRNIVFDIARDHPRLLEAVVALLRPNASLFFSTNHQNFDPRMDMLEVASIVEITARTIPEDYVSKRKTIHRCWRIDI